VNLGKKKMAPGRLHVCGADDIDNSVAQRIVAINFVLPDEGG
jgi:hypothetical protein